jgi:hypothetical protein
MNGAASNRQKKLLRFFGVKFRDSISIGAAGWEIARIMANEANRMAWRRYLYLTSDFGSESDVLKPFDRRILHEVVVPEEWSAGAAIDDFKSEFVAEFLKENSPYDLTPPAISIFQQKFIFTGKFGLGTREECQKLVESLGGIAPTQKTVSHSIDYLVVGKLGNSHWSHSDEGYGNKISAAILARREYGKPAIVSEDHWLREIASATGVNQVTKPSHPNREFLEDFWFHLPNCFSKSVVTRSFSVGDVIYDNASGYETTSTESLARIGVCLQVRSARPASPAGDGSVTADVFEPNETRSGLEFKGEFTVSQVDFIRVCSDD